MVIKSGEGVVYLTRPQKYFQSSYHPQKTNLSFQNMCHPEHACPGPPKKDANSPQYGQFPKKKMK